MSISVLFRNYAIALSAGLMVLGAYPAQSRQVPVVPAAATTDDPADYKLGPSDKIRVVVFGEADLSGEFVVSGSGSVSLPLVGDLSATGMTTQQFQESLRQKLADGYLREPRVSVEVLNYRPYYILGEVQKPGEYPFVSGLTVQNAVATAGGYTYRADTRKVFIKRATENTEQRLNFAPGENLSVKPGDTIRVGERFF